MHEIPGTIVIIFHQTFSPDSTSRFEGINHIERDDYASINHAVIIFTSENCIFLIYHIYHFGSLQLSLVRIDPEQGTTFVYYFYIQILYIK